MGKDSEISWTHHTFNPWWGCAKVSDGCKHCYADTFAKRTGNNVWGVNAERRFFGDKHWNEPLKWNEAAQKAGERHRVFCASMADVFEDRDDLHVHRARLFDLIRRTPHLDWLLLTKRPENILPALEQAIFIAECSGNRALAEWLEKWLDGNPPQNVWIGTSVENQKAADERIPHLLRVPAVIRFLSCEPLLGPVDLLRIDAAGFGGPVGHKVDCIRKGYWDTKWGFVNHSDMHDTFGPLHWVIAGGESGPNTRPCHPDWARGLRDQCKEAGVAFHWKQWGEWLPQCNVPEPHQPKQYLFLRNSGEIDKTGDSIASSDGWSGMGRVGKKAAGRLLDGEIWDEFPESEKTA